MTTDQYERLHGAIGRIHERIEDVRAELRADLKDARVEQAEDHRQVKDRLRSLEHGQTTIYKRITTLETHEQASQARQEGTDQANAEVRRRAGRLGALIVGTAVIATAVSGLVFQLIDRL